MKLLHELFLAHGSDLGAALVIPRTVLVFAAAVLYVRLAKKRFIAQASAMDLVVAVLFGSVLSRSVNGSGTLLSCLVSGFTLVALQRILAHFAGSYPRFERLVKGSCEVMVENGVPVSSQMRKHDITHDDLLSEMRLNALTDRIEDVQTAILERSGRISIVKKES